MGQPIVLFDKSFLQSLSVNEAVWFDHFFSPMICPLFFVETLADLSKPQRAVATRSPEEEVRIIAEKTPAMSGAPCVLHSRICIADLMGHEPPHLGQIPVDGGRPVRSSDGKPGVIFDPSPESLAFSRWQDEQFHAIERDFASSWREALSNLNLRELAARMGELGITPKSCKTVQQAYDLAASLVHSRFEPDKQLALLFFFLQIPHQFWGPSMARWSAAGFPPLAAHARYAAYVLKVELFFQIALAANLISPDRASNRVDLAYLFYLPFCHVFVSGDKLHQRCAPVFLEKNRQDFVWGPELKADLAWINEYFSSATAEEREQGLFRLAPRPPGEEEGRLVASLWRKHFPNHDSRTELPTPLSPEAERKLVDYVNSSADAVFDPEVAKLPSEDLQSVTLKRSIPARRGGWWLIPKDVADRERRD